MLRKAGEKRCYLRVFEVFKLGNHVVAFLARLDPIHEVLHAVPAQAEVIDAFGKHPGEEKGVIADVFAYLALAVERGRGTEHRIRFHQHLADIGQGLASGIGNFK